MTPIATPETCGRERYPNHDLAAIALEDSLHRAAYPCDDCRGWHLGERGSLTRCHFCDRPVLWRKRGRDLATICTDPATGRAHDRTCESWPGKRPPVVVIGRTAPGTCSTCTNEHKRIRTLEDGRTLCPPCYGVAKDGPRGGRHD